MDAYFGQKPLSNRCLGAAMTILALDRFNDVLSSLPPPGMGDGCNLRILGAANYGVFAGLEPDEIFRRIREAIPAGRRRVSDGEIIRAVEKTLRRTINQIPIDAPVEFVCHMSTVNVCNINNI